MSTAKARILEAATSLLLRRGVEGTAVDDILKASNTGKSQFYHYFGSKSGMVSQVLEHVRDDLNHGRWGAEALPAITGWADVEDWLRAMAGSRHSDHPLALLTLTMPSTERALQPALRQLYDEARAPLLAFLEREQTAGRLAPAISCEDLADLALTGVIGSTIKTSLNSNHDGTGSDKAARHLSLYLKAYARV